MKRTKYVLFALVAVFAAIQFVQPVRNVSGQAVRWPYTISDSAKILFESACFDCHTNNTVYPWYSYVQPMGWLIAKDVANGKAKLNFNELGSRSPRRQVSTLRDIENRIKDGTMPLAEYQIMHPRARLTERDKQVLIDWIDLSIQKGEH